MNKRRKEEKEPVIVKSKFKLLCETRWFERHTAFEDFYKLMEPLACTHEVVSQPVLHSEIKWDSKSIAEASGLLRDIRSSEFLVAFHVCRYFFAFPKDIAQLLQGSSMDVI